MEKFEQNVNAQELYNKTGIDLRHYEYHFFVKCVGKRMRACGVDTIDDYAAILNCDPPECQALAQSFTVYHSQFMRDPNKYRVLGEHILPSLLKGNGRTVRIWSAGCAAGEEPYSIAMIARETLRRLQSSCTVEILATDVNAVLLEKAQQGVYPPGELYAQNIGQYYLGSYFELTPDGSMAVKEEVRRMVTFRRADLFADRPGENNDIIFCRNVLIYFRQDAVQKVLQSLHRNLKDNGYLFLGNAEMMSDQFYCHFKKLKQGGEFYYRKIAENSEEFKIMDAKQKRIRSGLGI